jgi:dihydroorotate dehydrogenase
MLTKVKAAFGDSKALIGVGGVDSTASARAKLEAGADLVQLYTGYVFKGPGLIGDILHGLDSSTEPA